MQRRVLSLCLIGAALVGVAVFVHLRRTVEPAISAAREILRGASQAEIQVPDQIRETVYRVERLPGETGTPSAIRAQVAKRLALAQWSGASALAWHTNTFLLQSSLGRALTEEELLTLYLRLLPNEAGGGASRASRLYFDKDLSDLTPEEVVRLLAIGRSPDRFSPSKNPEATAKMQEHLWARYEQAGRDQAPVP